MTRGSGSTQCALESKLLVLADLRRRSRLEVEMQRETGNDDSRRNRLAKEEHTEP